jgi:ABC-type branched-subunit amino acid transport system substrate-binding protein
MSGESQSLGQAMMDAATLALYDAYMPLSPSQITAQVVLIPKDTGNSPASAAAAVEAVVQQGASLIIGPLYSGSVSAAAPVARRASVPMIALSNNRAVAGPGVYVYGFLPEQQVGRVAEYAARQNISSLAALLPNDAHGTAIAETLKSTLTGKGVRVEPVEMYSRSNATLTAAVARLKQGMDRAPAAALFLADGGDQLNNTLAALQAGGVERKTLRLIGTGLWDDDQVRQNPAMQGAWFASSPPNYYASFEKRFLAAYGYKPQRLASLAYDAVTLAAEITLKNGAARFDAGTLTNPLGFLGPGNGLYRFKADGTAERALAVMEISEGSVKTLDAAPKAFDK